MLKLVADFKVGEKVVYPAHGVGVIESLQVRNVSGTQKKFYMLRIVDSEMTIMIPTENVQTVGLRRIIGRDMVSKVYKILREKKVEVDQQTWNRRYREYTEKIKTGSVQGAIVRRAQDARYRAQLAGQGARHRPVLSRRENHGGAEDDLRAPLNARFAVPADVRGRESSLGPSRFLSEGPGTGERRRGSGFLRSRSVPERESARRLHVSHLHKPRAQPIHRFLDALATNGVGHQTAQLADVGLGHSKASHFLHADP